MNQDHPVAKPRQVKVCGIRDPAESAALDLLGVDWIGYNFHPASARYVPPADVAPMVRALKRAKPVGVFVDADIRFVIEVAAETGIRYVQLHGGEDWDYVMRMTLPVIKAIPHTRLADLGGLREGMEAAARQGAKTPLIHFLVDTQAAGAGIAGIPGASGAIGAGTGQPAAGGAPGEFGGSGKTFDWSLLKRHPLPLPYFLAGGLGPHNLAQALAACSPFAVDLNSKVEVSPGRKDMGKVKACLDIVKTGLL
jgi:phosphoribosylanthranilate isomerase